MNLKQLSNIDLENQIKSFVAKERSLLYEILLIIREIDRRQLYLELGYPNLFAYLTEKIGFSEGSVQRRIDAARLLRELPNIGPLIESGALNLSHISLVQKACRTLRRKDKIISASLKADTLHAITHTPRLEAERIVSQKLELPIRKSAQVNAQADGSVRIEFTLDKAQYEKFKKLKELLSHSVPSGEIELIVEYLADKIIREKTQKSNKNKNSEKELNPNRASDLTATVAAEGCENSHTKPITVNMRKDLHARDQECQFTDPETGKKCQSRWQLEADHLQPRWAEGKTDLENLRFYCKNHNQYKYRKEAHIEFRV